MLSEFNFQRLTTAMIQLCRLFLSVYRRKFYDECILFDTNSTNFAHTYKNKQLL